MPMREVRLMSLRDVEAMAAVIAEERIEQGKRELEAKRRQGRRRA